jgi:glycosyltransferase involved in cell wall biosynthesis
MKVLFIGDYVDSEKINYYNSISTKNFKIAISSIKYTKYIADGLKFNLDKDSTNLFLVPVAMYPNCKKIFLNNSKIDDNYFIPYINLFIFKQLSIALYVFLFSLRWFIVNLNKKKIIVFSNIYFPFLLSVLPFKILKNIFIVSFIPDLPEFAFSFQRNSLVRKTFSFFYIKISMLIVNVSDFFVFITPLMKFKFSNKPYMVIEGFTEYQGDSLKYLRNYHLEEKKAVMYSGALYEKYGLEYLLKSFCKIEGDFELWIFGHGPMEDEIISYSEKDVRIKYFGYKTNSEVLLYQKKARILINPRPSNEEFTKYSFPSKLLEYMSSGTPVLTTRLPGIPEDYTNLMYFIEDETFDGFYESLYECLNKSQLELDNFGELSREYVINEKNNVVQIKKLINKVQKIF